MLPIPVSYTHLDVYKRQCIYRYAITHQVELIYVRSFHNANPFTIRLFSKLRKAGIKIAMEIPTSPYDSEYAGFPLRCV